MVATSLAVRLRSYVQAMIDGPQMVAFVPALSLGALWLGGELALMAVALGLPIVVWVATHSAGLGATGAPRDSVTGMLLTADWRVRALTRLETAGKQSRRCAIFMLRIDDLDQVLDRYGQNALDDVVRQIAARISSALRSDDIVTHAGDGVFQICLSPQQVLDLEICLQLAGRLAAAAEEPLSVDGTRIYVSACIGFCQLGREEASIGTVPGEATITCAARALETAVAAGPAAIRAFSPDAPALRNTSENNEVLRALEEGEFQAWFQPQISTDTGKITGFEALARWVAPKRGIVSPAEFLPQLEAAGALGRLSEVMLYQSLTALRAWDQAGVDVPQVGVNFASTELSDPEIVNKVSWELDRFDLDAERLAVEILETVVAREPDDVISRNIAGLGALGCRIDLDDFGTGHASLASIRRFSVGRIKIDRSFVMKADRDPEQQRMVNAIISMAERLDIETLAEGVETVGEHALLAQLGCNHVQGFGIGRPMPFDQTLEWIRAHNGKLQDAPRIGRAGS